MFHLLTFATIKPIVKITLCLFVLNFEICSSITNLFFGVYRELIIKRLIYKN